MNRTLVALADEITAQAHMCNARIVCGMYSHRLSLVEKYPDYYEVTKVARDHLNMMIRYYNRRMAGEDFTERR